VGCLSQDLTKEAMIELTLNFTSSSALRKCHSNLIHFYDAVGLGILGVPLPLLSAWIWAFEMLLGVLCLGVPVSAFFLFVCVWKLGTEWLYVPAQAYGTWWEVMERGSSYTAPLLWIGFQQCVDRTRWHAFGVRWLLRM
jgi:hypothetical protein